MHLLVTRPEPDGERTAATLRTRGHDVMLAPLLRIEAVADADLGGGPFAAILLTSANGARALAKHQRRDELLELPVLAVGRSSADAARSAGFADAVSADGDSGDLARLAAACFGGIRRPLLYLSGEDRAHDLASALAVRGLAVCTVVIYRAVKARSFTPEALAALAGIDGVVHFSRRSVETYLDCAVEVLDRALKPVHFCLSPRVAEPLKVAGAAIIRVAPRPDEDALMELVGRA